MSLSVVHNSKHKVAAHPPELVHGDDGGDGQRLQEM